MIIDTHAHLYYDEVLNNIEEVLKRAEDAGIEKVIVPAVDLESSHKILKLADKYDMIYAVLGIHPGDVNKCSIKMIDEIFKLTDHEKVVGIGETGLDYYWDTSNIEKQKTFFSLQIEMALQKDLPVVIHTRSSLDDAISIVKKYVSKGLRGQFHCFSGNTNQMEEIMNFENFYISFCGNVTYKNFDSLEAVKNIPLDKLLSETDTPFLPPVPYRGKKNEPAYITHTIEKIALIKDHTPETLKNTLYQNAKELFF